MFMSWLRKVVGIKSRAPHFTRRLTDKPRWKRVKLYTERLEDRLTPATILWTGASGVDTNWSTFGNWETTALVPCAAPTSSDVADFDSSVSNVGVAIDHDASGAATPSTSEAFFIRMVSRVP